MDVSKWDLRFLLKQSHPTSMQFLPSDDPAFVLVQKNGKEIAKTSMQLATASYLLVTEPTNSEQGLVMFSLCVPQESAKSIVACVRRKPRKSKKTRPPVWPAWNPAPAPAFVSNLPTNEWVSLPVTGLDCQRVLENYATQRERREIEVNHQISDRCKEIKEQGTDENYTDSLGYYITLRVKLAYLLLNQDGIEKRLKQVEDCRAITRKALDQSPPDLEGQWELPTSIMTPEDNNDPNALVCPQVADYGIDD